MLREEQEEENNLKTEAIPLDIKSNPKFIEIREEFENLFKSKGYIGNKKIEKDVWFLQNDLAFQNMIKPSSTPSAIEINRMHSLLRELNEKDDFKKISIDSRIFIERISEMIYNSHRMASRSKEIIKAYRAHENVNVLELKLKMLNEKIKDNIDAISKLEINVSRLDHLPRGDYQIIFHFMERSPRDPTMTTSKNHKLKDDKFLSIKQGSDIIVLNKQDLFNCFEAINLTALDVNDDPNFLGSLEYSGSTLSTFNLQLFKNNELFAESNPGCFLDIFLNLKDKLRDIEQSSLSTNLKIKVKTNFEQKNISGLLPQYQVILDFKFELDPVTRACIIKRVLHLLKDAIKTQTQNEILKNEILDIYFKSISEQVNEILNRNEDEISEGNTCCQNSCNIF
jgi:hypothetical protein